MHVLDRIVAAKRDEVARLRASPIAPRRAPPPRSLAGALRRPPAEPLRIVAEIKHRSPSAGALSRALSPAERARSYAAAGATAVSVLCDGPFFDGSYEDLAQARSAVEVPVLCKEFVLDPAQVARADAAGADAVLLVVRLLDDRELLELVGACRARGLDALVEVADERELERALAAGADLVGVNARDLDTLGMDAVRAARVLAAIPHDVVAVHLSGLRDADAVGPIARGRADAALVGEALMRLDDPAPLLRAMALAARTAGSRRPGT